MLLSFALIFIVGMLLSSLCKKVGLPGLIGMILTGILIGPYCLNWIDESVLNISSQLRKIALIIILLRAGISLDVSDLKKVGRPAILLCFVPACFEIIGMLVLGPKLLGISLSDSFVMGCVVAAVSPAVIVPKMLQLMSEKYGTDKSIPQMILAGASVDDVFVIVLFSMSLSLAQGQAVNLINLLSIPISILAGILIGALCGKLISVYFKKISLDTTIQTIVLLSVSFILVTIEDSFSFPFSGLIAVMTMGVFVQRITQSSHTLNELWTGAQVLLFVLVGACVNISSALNYGFSAILLVFGVLLFRMIGVLICLLNTKLNRKERLFCMIAYCPKATVQAAIGGVALSMGLACGEIVLTVVVLSILITAPLGSFLIEHTYKNLLTKKRIRLNPYSFHRLLLVL